jgi:hypothetical protein
MGHPAVRGELPDAAGADERVGILRLRMRIQKANPHASLRMTGRRVEILQTKTSD